MARPKNRATAARPYSARGNVFLSIHCRSAEHGRAAVARFSSRHASQQPDARHIRRPREKADAALVQLVAHETVGAIPWTSVHSSTLLGDVRGGAESAFSRVAVDTQKHAATTENADSAPSRQRPVA
jgi:hypothetical protein